MKVYHGSQVPVPEPDTAHSRRTLDFGPGFYVTPLREQAESWALRFSRNNPDTQAVLSIYDFDEAALNEAKVLRFTTYDDTWLDFVVSCRRQMDTTDFDIVIGGVANDRIFDTVELYFDGLIDQSQALQRLRFERPNQQICFRTQPVLDSYLRFLESETL